MSKLTGFIVIFACSISALGCAPKEKKHDAVLAVAEPFQGFVSEFEADSAAQGVSLRITDLSVNFGRTPNLNETGVCIVTEGETPQVVINASIWATLSDDDRREVIYHELGHCVYRRLHRSGEVADYTGFSNIPASLMYAYRIPGVVMEANRPYYMGELFTRSRFNQF